MKKDSTKKIIKRKNDKSNNKINSTKKIAEKNKNVKNNNKDKAIKKDANLKNKKRSIK